MFTTLTGLTGRPGWNKNSAKSWKQAPCNGLGHADAAPDLRFALAASLSFPGKSAERQQMEKLFSVRVTHSRCPGESDGTPGREVPPGCGPMRDVSQRHSNHGHVVRERIENEHRHEQREEDDEHSHQHRRTPADGNGTCHPTQVGSKHVRGGLHGVRCGSCFSL